MLITDLGKEIRAVLRSEGKTLEQAGATIGMCRQDVWRLTKRDYPSPKLMDLMDALGYDVEINFIKREK